MEPECARNQRRYPLECAAAVCTCAAKFMSILSYQWISDLGGRRWPIDLTFRKSVDAWHNVTYIRAVLEGGFLAKQEINQRGAWCTFIARNGSIDCWGRRHPHTSLLVRLIERKVDGL